MYKMDKEQENRNIVKEGKGNKALEKSGINGVSMNKPDFQVIPTIQMKRNGAGLPEQLKEGIEKLSGISMNDVKVHYNSSKPAQVQAHAYTQGNHIHVGSGQEKYLSHEAWHVVQQKQGRVCPTGVINQVQINDDKALEQEADKMGDKALHQ